MQESSLLHLAIRVFFRATPELMARVALMITIILGLVQFSTPFQGLTTLQVFLLGLMVALTPGMIVVAILAWSAKDADD